MTHTLTYRIHEVAPYINWIYFFHAWGFPPRFAAISRIHGCDACRAGWLAEFPEEERARAAEAMQLFKDANRMLAQLDGDFHTHVRFGLYPACSDGDDLLLTDPEQEGRTLRLALLRQQHTTKPDEPFGPNAVRPFGRSLYGKNAPRSAYDLLGICERRTVVHRRLIGGEVYRHPAGRRLSFPAGPVCQLRAVGMVGVSGNRYPADRKRSHGAACFGVPSLRTLLCHRKNRGRPVGRLCPTTRPARGNDA